MHEPLQAVYKERPRLPCALRIDIFWFGIVSSQDDSHRELNWPFQTRIIAFTSFSATSDC